MVGQGRRHRRAVAELAEDLVNAGLANREAMARMVKVELDRALGRVGLATMDEVDELTRRVRDLEEELGKRRRCRSGEPVKAPEGRGQEDRREEGPGARAVYVRSQRRCHR